MTNKMDDDLFARCNYGRVALRKLAPVADNFRLFSAGWQEDDWNTMKVVGAEFRVAKAGPNKGSLSIMIKGTQRTAYVTREEMAAVEAAAAPA